MTQIAHCAEPVLISMFSLGTNIILYRHIVHVREVPCRYGLKQVSQKKRSKQHGKNVSCPLRINQHIIHASTACLKMALSFSHCGEIPSLDAQKLNVSQIIWTKRMVPLGCFWHLYYNEMCGLLEVFFFPLTTEPVQGLVGQTQKLEQMNTAHHNVILMIFCCCDQSTSDLACIQWCTPRGDYSMQNATKKPTVPSTYWSNNLNSLRNCPLAKEKAVRLGKLNTLWVYLSSVESCLVS